MISTIPTDTVVTRRRWLPRFSLRSLLILIMVLGGVFGTAMLWYRSQEDEYQWQQQVVEQIELHHGRVSWSICAPRWWPFRESHIFDRITEGACSSESNAEAIASTNELAKIHTLATLFIFNQTVLDDPEFIAALKKLSFVRKVAVEVNSGWAHHGWSP